MDMADVTQSMPPCARGDKESESSVGKGSDTAGMIEVKDRLCASLHGAKSSFHLSCKLGCLKS